MGSYDFGRFRLDADGRLLYRDDKRVRLTPKAVDLLLTLVESKGTPLTREDLLHKVWSDATVEEGTLSSHISLLRKTLGEGFIETIPKRGYRFAGAVQDSRQASGRLLLVVLPFENLSGAKKDDAFGDGLTEEMITQLGRTTPERLGVIARTSSMTYKSTKKTIEQIGRELGVSHVLEGSVRRGGNRVRISAQLIQVSDQTHVWADNYESEIEDILALQSDVAREVARQIHILLLPAPVKRVVPQAYEAYVQGRYIWNRRSETDLYDSLRFFEKAIEKDPEYAPPYAGMADTYLSLMDYGYIALAEATAKARPMALKALELDETAADAHVSLGHAAFHEFDFPSAAIEFGRALQLNPNSFTARYYYSNYLLAMDRNEEAISEAEEARRLDPISPASNSNLISILWFSERFDEAVVLAKRTLTLHADNARVYEDLGRSYEQMGRFNDAIKMLKKSIALGGGLGRTSASLAHAYAVAGRHDEAIRILKTLQQRAKTRFVPAYDFALIFTGLGEYDEAFTWLDKAYAERSPALPFMKSNPRLAKLRTDARFHKLLKLVGLER